MDLTKFFAFRKTIKKGPLNFTVSKSGITVSLGIPGIPGRVRIKTDGTVGVSASKNGLRFSRQRKLRTKASKKKG